MPVTMMALRRISSGQWLVVSDQGSGVSGQLKHRIEKPSPKRLGKVLYSSPAAATDLRSLTPDH